ncbi:MAG: hypothetical protein G3M70_07125 [Candidatus Nitronauta litoralis]|uniref:Uncharacterized protein n=1 Tax=Candidatus Nitronauta litoralis TaxID=2705533 RepID=A0A7T0G088_9BACT|nr:MAG: hypothetical protein G3M70_07125 [Candidatus Nitronauta litoralis]
MKMQCQCKNKHPLPWWRRLMKKFGFKKKPKVIDAKAPRLDLVHGGSPHIIVSEYSQRNFPL